MPVRPLVSTLNTVSYGSQLVTPLIVRYSAFWVNPNSWQVRTSVTFFTTYPLSRNVSEVPAVGLSMACTYWRVGSVLLIVANPYAPSFQAPGSRPPYMYPPPSTPWIDS